MTSTPPGELEEVSRDDSPPLADVVPATSSPAEGTGEPEPTYLGLRFSDQVVLAVIAGVSLAILGAYYWKLNSRGVETIAIDRPADRVLEFQVEVNSSTWVEWMQLEGIGETLARRIIEDREQNGPFKSVDDVDRVKGIGKVTLERILPHLRCSDCSESHPALTTEN